MPKLKTYSNRESRRFYAEAVEIEINSANKGNKQLAAKAKILKIKAEATERGGSFVLREIVNGKSKGRSVPEWRQVESLAPECFRGPRSEQWLWRMLDELGLAISGGTRNTGPLTATMKEKEGAQRAAKPQPA